MRNPGHLYAVLQREVDTNQRIYFDINSTNQYVVSGSTSGSLKIWDIKGSSTGVETYTGDNEKVAILPEVFYDDTLHDDCINGVNFHPNHSEILATCSGQRHHKLDLSTWNCSSDEESGNEQSYNEDSSLKVWNFGIFQEFT